MKGGRLARSVMAAAIALLASSSHGTQGVEDGGIAELVDGALVCDVQYLDGCLKDPRAGALREFVRRLAAREPRSWDPVGDWYASEDLVLSGNGCLSRYGTGIGTSDGDQYTFSGSGSGLRDTVEHASQIIRLKVSRIRTVLFFSPHEKLGPEDPLYVTARTLVDAEVEWLRSRTSDPAAAQPGESVQVVTSTHPPFRVADYVLCTDGAPDGVLAELSPGDTVFVFLPHPGWGMKRTAEGRPTIFQHGWSDVMVFSADQAVKHVPGALADSKATRLLDPDQFERGIEEARSWEESR